MTECHCATLRAQKGRESGTRMIDRLWYEYVHWYKDITDNENSVLRRLESFPVYDTIWLVKKKKKKKKKRVFLVSNNFSKRLVR